MNRLSRQIRSHVIEMAYRCKASHVGSSLSLCEILAALYGSVLKEDEVVFVSKGHAAMAVYAALALTGRMPLHLLDDYLKDGSLMQGHISHYLSGIPFSTGSLGHALPVATGYALAKPDQNHYVILSDGELNEGSNWEALLFAPKHVSNLTVIVDYNKIQSLGTTQEVLDLEPLVDKMVAFGWNCARIDGHDVPLLEKTLRSSSNLIIADTVKGKGIKALEHKLASHYKPPTEDQYAHSIYQCAD